MIITKEVIDAILNQEFTEDDWDKRSGGPCKTVYQISNLFHDKEFAKHAIEKILLAYSQVVQQ